MYLVSHFRGKKHLQAVEDVQKEKNTDDIVSDKGNYWPELHPELIFKSNILP